MERKHTNTIFNAFERIGQARLTSDEEVIEDYLQQVDDIVFEQEHPWLYETKKKDGCIPSIIGIIGLSAISSALIIQRLVS